MIQNLRVHQPVTERAIEIGVEAIHDLIDLRFGLRVRWIARRAGYFRQTFKNGGTFNKPEIAIFQHWNKTTGIDFGERFTVLLSGHDIEDLLVNRQPLVGYKHHYRTAGCGCRMLVKFQCLALS